jgi:hypothetical protein
MQPGMGTYCYLTTPACPSSEVSVGLDDHFVTVSDLLSVKAKFKVPAARRVGTSRGSRHRNVAASVDCTEGLKRTKTCRDDA